MNNKAFSLIELMVVIAIVALLAGVALPAYNSYVDQAKSAQVQAIMDTYKQQAITWYTEKGTWPDAGDFGFDTLGGFGFYVANPEELSPLITQLTMAEAGAIANCGADGNVTLWEITANFDPDQFSTLPGPDGSAWRFMVGESLNGTFVSQCLQYTDLEGNYIPCLGGDTGNPTDAFVEFQTKICQ